MLIRKILILFLLAISLTISHAQVRVAVKTNLPYLLTTTPNLGAEIALTNNISFEITGGYNPFVFKNSTQIKHWVFWPELRYWLWEHFNGHFFGVHGVFGDYDVAGIKLPIDKLPSLEDKRVDGIVKGGGISYGYQWVIGNNFVLELTAGAGMARIEYDVYTIGENGVKTNQGKKNYFGPTKGALAIAYVF